MNEGLKTIVGLEIHVQLNTKSKMFCGCSNEQSSRISRESGIAHELEKPNTRVCPICMGYPGTLPAANVEAIKKTILTGLALNCQVLSESKFDRKHYFYPDLPKNFQISQYDQPFCKNGELRIINHESGEKRIRINRVHLEEDAGKLIHPKGAGYTLVDMNRCGTPLMEIVTEPDIDSSELAKIFLKELRLIVRYLGVSDADMEKGHLRCDANISIAKSQISLSKPDPASRENIKSQIETTSIIEIKNMNSFRAVEAALKFEEQRLRQNFESLKKEKGKQTRMWSEKDGITKPMRAKEEASDYRYFPEPDIPSIRISNKKSKIKKNYEINLDEIKKGIPELPEERRRRYQKLGLDEKAAETIVAKKSYSDYFDEAVRSGGEAHKIYDLMINEKVGANIPLKNLIMVIKLVSEGALSQKMLKVILPELIKGKNPNAIIKEKGMKQMSNEGELKVIIKKMIKANPQAVESYQKGKLEALGFLVGQVMRETHGQANPELTNKLLKDLLK